MIVFITGASGFIGSRVVAALVDAGHEVICAVRNVPKNVQASSRVRFVQADLARDTNIDTWLPRLRGVDAVINAAGILREETGKRFADIHVAGPVALFSACAKAGVQRIIQVSALGADEDAVSGYHVSKREADRYLASLPVAWTIVQPSLVYGPGGRSAQLFEMLASGPVVPVPGNGEQGVQPVHIEDVAEGVLALLSPQAPARAAVAFVGPAPLTLRTFLIELRAALGIKGGRILRIPVSVVRLAAVAGRWNSGALLDRETLTMLERGNTADPGPFARLLGRAPRPVPEFIPPAYVPAVRVRARTRWLLPVLRVSLALLWIVSGAVSFGLYPVEKSLQLLARVGLEGMVASLALYGAAALDILLGVATLIAPSRRLWLAQAALIAIYTVIISIFLPELWLEPFAPVLKNAPILAMLWLMHQLEER